MKNKKLRLTNEKKYEKEKEIFCFLYFNCLIGGRSHQSSNNSNRSNRRKEESLKIHVSDEEYEYVDDEEEDGIYEQDGLYDL